MSLTRSSWKPLRLCQARDVGRKARKARRLGRPNEVLPRAWSQRAEKRLEIVVLALSSVLKLVALRLQKLKQCDRQ